MRLYSPGSSAQCKRCDIVPPV